METMMAESEDDWIKRRAYELWESEGHPTGKDSEHWERARHEYASAKPGSDASSKASGKTSGKSVETAAAPKAEKPAKAAAGAGKAASSAPSSTSTAKKRVKKVSA
jgi:hypothetical protein